MKGTTETSVHLLSMSEMSAESCVSIAEAKATEESHRAPLRLMTQFLRAVSESRMENALALAQTILKFEPQNAIILDYQATLAQYINNEREEGSTRERDVDDGGDEKSSRSEGPSETSTGPEDGESDEVSTEEASGDETSTDERETENMTKAPGGESRNKVSLEEDMGYENELRHLGGVLKQLRETRITQSREVASRWDEEKFAADRREVEEVLWKFLPDEEKRAAEKRSEEQEPGIQRGSRGHKD